MNKLRKKGTHPNDKILHSKFISDLFEQSQKDPTFGFFNLAHSDLTVFHSFKPNVEKTFINSNE